MATVHNSLEHSYRARKAIACADLLAAVGCEPDDVMDLPESTWAGCATIISIAEKRAVGIPSTATRILTAEILRHRETEKATDDPFAGIGTRG